MSDTIKETSSGVAAEKFNKDYNKLKHDLELWRECILLVDTMLKWDKPIYTTCLSLFVTVMFLFIWYLNMTVMTFAALAGILVLVADYAYPKVVRFLFRPEAWTGDDQKRYELVCLDLCRVLTIAKGVVKLIFTPKDQRTTKYYVCSLVSLACIVYLCESVDNLLLCYVAIMSVVLFPGFHATHLANNVQAKVMQLLGKYIPSLAPKED